MPRPVQAVAISAAFGVSRPLEAFGVRRREPEIVPTGDVVESRSVRQKRPATPLSAIDYLRNDRLRPSKVSN